MLTMSDTEPITTLIKNLAAEAGFDACGIAPAMPLEAEHNHLLSWLSNGYHAGMEYMQKHADKRRDPAMLVENARSVIVFLYNYFPGQPLTGKAGYDVSAYAYGDDYHDVIRQKLNAVIDTVKQVKPEAQMRGFVDSAPVLERAWAARAGLGWIGRNSMLISRSRGSYFFIAQIITDLELKYDEPLGGSYCGDCSRCIDACPTGAITGDRQVDSNRCISYHTIENKGEIPETLHGHFQQWIFGCDVCQQVCPWNRFAVPHREAAFEPAAALLNLTADDWENMEKEQFDRIFAKSALKRTKFEGLKRNIRFVKEN